MTRAKFPQPLPRRVLPMASLSLVYALQSISVAAAAATPYHIMVIDRYNDTGTAWSKTQITQMGGGQADPRQLFG
jgi:cysteinyl-tRNA synthetase, unknown class